MITKKITLLGTWFLSLVMLVMPFNAHAVDACFTFSGQQVCDAVSASIVNGLGGAVTSALGAGFDRQGITGCNTTGAALMSFGTVTAIGSTYVPVSDAAVTQNTGYLAYKECVLRGLVNRQVEATLANLLKQGTESFTKGRNGGPMYVENLSNEELANQDETISTALATNGELSALNPAFQSQVKTAVARNYYLQTRSPSSAVKCSYTGTPAQLDAILHGRGTGGMSDVMVLTDPNCNPFYAYNNAQSLIQNNLAREQNNMLTQLAWGNGVYPVETTDADGTRRVTTPGYLVAGTMQQLLGTGLQRTLNANDIDQMIGSTFANIGNNILSQVRGGLLGLTVSVGGAPSTLTQITQSAASGLQTSVTNTALQILLATRQIEIDFLAAENRLKDVLTRAITDLRTAEYRCWDLIIPRVRTAANASVCTTGANGTTCTGQVTLNIATSTAFSARVIDDPTTGIRPLVVSTASAIDAATASLNRIDTLITSVGNTGDATAQQTALQQLNTLVSQGALHNQSDLQTVQQQIRDAQTSINGTVTDTITAWGDSTTITPSDPMNAQTNIGWCNVNNPAVTTMWLNKWRQ